MKKNIILDFDGVILNTHKLKTEAFYYIFKPYGKKIAKKSKNFHLKNIGKNRFYKFNYIFNKFIKKKISQSISKSLDVQFDNYLKKKTKRLKVSDYLINFLKKDKKYNFYISTSTPLDKIKILLKEKKIYKSFKKVFGSPRSKDIHIRIIKKNKNPTLFIGDSVEDYNVSKKNRVKFILKINSENIGLRKMNKNLKKINSFKNIDFLIDNMFK